MFGKRYKLFSLLGFQVYVDLSWIVIAALVTWTLALGLFPILLPDLPAATYWWMAVLGALGLFGSIIFHEFAHSVVARRYGIPMKGITLFLFGGVAEMSEEPKTAKSEFYMAAAGPVSSLFLAGAFYMVYSYGGPAGWPPTVTAIFYYLAFINFILVVFNMVPAFPLDGGRILRSALWGWKGNIRWATRVAAGAGSVFGFALIFLGILTFLMGNFIGGIWWFLIGLFIRSASSMSYQQVLIREALQGEPVHRFMKHNPVAVSPSISLRELVDDYIYQHHFKMYPVVRENERLVGCVSSKQVKSFAPDEWERHRVEEVISSCGPDNTIGPNEDSVKALQIMSRTGNSRLMVVDRGRLVGILALKDLLEFLSIKMDLEGEMDPRRSDAVERRRRDLDEEEYRDRAA
jgi:Zn-dependent protease/predicted transcriptional regulator